MNPQRTLETVVGADGDLELRVKAELKSHHRPAWRQIEVSAQGGTVKLCGQMNSFHEKQLCLQACRQVDGVVELVDDLSVSHS